MQERLRLESRASCSEQRKGGGLYERRENGGGLVEEGRDGSEKATFGKERTWAHSRGRVLLPLAVPGADRQHPKDNTTE